MPISYLMLTDICFCNRCSTVSGQRSLIFIRRISYLTRGTLTVALEWLLKWSDLSSEVPIFSSKMINCWVLLVLALISIPSVISNLPLKNDVPVPVLTIQENQNAGTPAPTIKATIDVQICKFGLDELKQYCVHLAQREGGKFLGSCVALQGLYKTLYQRTLIQNPIENNNFNTERLDGYLNEIGARVGRVHMIEDWLKKALVEDGWKELKDYCTSNHLPQYKPACEFVMETV